jgi:hypothetical protein
MDKISRVKLPNSPDQGLNNYGARQFEYAFVKRLPLPPRGKSASEFVQCVCQNSYCVGSISCVGCVPQLRKMLRTASCTALRTASSIPRASSASASRSVASVLRPVACQLRSCASPNSMLSRMFRNSRRAATAMKVQRTAERLAHIVSLHKRALVELSKVGVPVGSSVSRLLSASSSELRRSALNSDELSSQELSSQELSSQELSSQELSSQELSSQELSSQELSSQELSAASPSRAFSSVPRPCELRPVASVASSELRQKRESPLRKFASVVSHTSSIKSVCVKSALVESASVNPSSVASLRPPKRSVH